MSTKARLTEAMKEALKGGLKDRLGVVRMLITEVRNAEINDLQNPGKEKSEEEVIATIANYHKNIKKTMQEYPPDRQAKFVFELGIIEEFLPKQLSETEVIAELKTLIATQDSKEFSTLMKLCTPHFKGRAEGKLVVDCLKKVLAGA